MTKRDWQNVFDKQTVVIPIEQVLAKPLEQNDIIDIFYSVFNSPFDSSISERHIKFARAIEAKHGIK